MGYSLPFEELPSGEPNKTPGSSEKSLEEEFKDLKKEIETENKLALEEGEKILGTIREIKEKLRGSSEEK